MNKLSVRLVPDALWAEVEPLIPPPNARPRGGGKARLDNRAVFTAIVFVLTSPCTWHQVPPNFGVTAATAHRRFTEWTEAGLWDRLHRAILNIDNQELANWARTVVDAATARTTKHGL